MVQLHSRVQVVDLNAEEIVYSPKDGETVTRTLNATQGERDLFYAHQRNDNGVAIKRAEMVSFFCQDGQVSATTETILIPSGTNRTETLDLRVSDRIVNQDNRVRLRVTSASERLRVMSVPSVISVYSAAQGKLQRLQRFNVYRCK